ncbi:type I restriction enzyme, S subunit [Intestinibacter bartlettii DSM 16795]|uniref:Type I restriction modification DNA specificity domain-containing protein n=3 Tax=root TaxID=1 RepID=W1WM89_9ZZZZ|nr:restriction endonuclease subunit S [Intestinibacter bartlettii]EDQ96163.1 type I restriction modification DNA specificity domain protein [Intestinibacter bartlettii DSM 16795]UWO79836.1 restriction endonuclease subunit S [Intestinibacter bartlettii]SKA51845.1 type I restriction enzyme, S subunit [Intestinibacter bartlettii DSM 16795]
MSCSDWKTVKLEEVVDILGDGLHGTPKYSDDGEYYFINGNNLDGKIIVNEKTKRVGLEQYLKYKKDLNDRTLLVSINGTLGKVAEYGGEDIILGKSACYFNVKKDVNKKYIKYILLSDIFKHYIHNYSTGTTIKNLGLKQMRKFKFPLPNIEEQEKIANILSSLDDKIELNNEMNKTLEEMAQSIFKRWFIDFEFPNEDGQPYKSSGGEMVESELGMIPKEWEIAQIDDISQVTMGVSPSSKTYNEDNIGLPLLNGAADFEGKLIKPSKFTSEPKKICKKGDMVFGVRATIGNIVFADKEYALGRGVASVEPNDKVFREFIYYSLDNSMENLINNASGSVFLNLKKADITDLKVCYSDEIVKKFNNISRVLIDKIVENDMESELLKQQRDILLPKLVSGEIRITN